MAIPALDGDLIGPEFGAGFEMAARYAYEGFTVQITQGAILQYGFEPVDDPKHPYSAEMQREIPGSGFPIFNFVIAGSDEAPIFRRSISEYDGILTSGDYFVACNSDIWTAVLMSCDIKLADPPDTKLAFISTIFPGIRDEITSEEIDEFKRLFPFAMVEAFASIGQTATKKVLSERIRQTRLKIKETGDHRHIPNVNFGRVAELGATYLASMGHERIASSFNRVAML